MTRRSVSDRGSASIELLGMLPLMLVVVLAVVQGCLTLAAVNSADSAARAGARVLSHREGPAAAAQASRAATTPWLRDRSDFSAEPNGVAVVRVHVPVLIPQFGGHLFDVTRRAWLPED